MSSGKRCSSRFWRLAFGNVIAALDEVANSVFVDGGGAEKSILNGTLAALGTLVAVGAVGSVCQVCLNVAYQDDGDLPLRVTLRNFQCSAPAQLLPNPLSK